MIARLGVVEEEEKEVPRKESTWLVIGGPGSNEDATTVN